MTISNFVAYVKQLWKNKPDTSTPLSAERMLHMESGIKGNSDAIEKLAAAVVSQIVNDPNKIASMAAVYALSQKIGDTAQLPEGTGDLVSAFTGLNTKIKKISVKDGVTLNFVVSNNVMMIQFLLDNGGGYAVNIDIDNKITYAYIQNGEWISAWTK